MSVEHSAEKDATCGDVLPLRYGSATCVREQGHDGPHRERLASCYTSGAREWESVFPPAVTDGDGAA